MLFFFTFFFIFMQLLSFQPLFIPMTDVLAMGAEGMTSIISIVVWALFLFYTLHRDNYVLFPFYFIVLILFIIVIKFGCISRGAQKSKAIFYNLSIKTY